MRTSGRSILIPILTPILVVLTACGSGSNVKQGNQVQTRSIPTGAEEVVFRVDSRGGFTPIEYQLGIVPEISVFGDGRVVVSGPVTEQYPPRALPNLLTGTLDRAALERLAGRAKALGLFTAHEYGQPGITDMPTTTVTINVDGVHRHEVYALEGPGTDAPGLSASEREARSALSKFVQELSADATDAASQPYEPAEVAMYATPVSDRPLDDAVPPTSEAWPLGALTELGTPIDGGQGSGTAYRCTVLRDANAVTALAAASDASTTSQWRSGGSDFTIVWRPLLPDEHDCP